MRPSKVQRGGEAIAGAIEHDDGVHVDGHAPGRPDEQAASYGAERSDRDDQGEDHSEAAWIFLFSALPLARGGRQPPRNRLASGVDRMPPFEPAPRGFGVLEPPRRLAVSPGKPSPRGWQVQNEREPADRSDADSGAGHGIGEVVPSQADDGDGDDACQHTGRCRDQYAQRPCLSRVRRDEKQHRDRGGKREHGCGMSARIGEHAQTGAVDQGLEGLRPVRRKPEWRPRRARRR